MRSPLHRLVTFQQERLVRAHAFLILSRPPPGIPSYFMPSRTTSTAAKNATAHLGFEAKLWLTGAHFIGAADSAQFYTQICVVRCLAEMLATYNGRICDPGVGSGGMSVKSEKPRHPPS